MLWRGGSLVFVHVRGDGGPDGPTVQSTCSWRVTFFRFDVNGARHMVRPTISSQLVVAGGRVGSLFLLRAVVVRNGHAVQSVVVQDMRRWCLDNTILNIDPCQPTAKIRIPM